MSCFAHVARKATAIEYAQEYCRELRKRSKALAHAYPARFGGARDAFEVTCSDYRSAGVADADVITWWEQTPLENIPALKHLHAEQQALRVRRNAEAILLFDLKWHLDRDGWTRLCPLARWSAAIDFDEKALCLSQNGGRSPKSSATCSRAFGRFVVVGISVADGRIPRLGDGGAWRAADYEGCVEKHQRLWAQSGTNVAEVAKGRAVSSEEPPKKSWFAWLG